MIKKPHTTTPEETPPAGGPSRNTGKLMTRRIRAHNRSTLILSYSASDANALRMAVQSIRLAGDRTPSLSLIARRSLGLYLDRMRALAFQRPDLFKAEVEALDMMGTPKGSRTLTPTAP